MATPAQAFVLAGLVRLGTRRPVLVVTPTGASADQLAHDLAAFAGGDGDGDGVEVFPAWETLPFERVSPDVSTMGRRLRLLWQLGGPDRSGRRRASWSPRSRPPCSGSARGARRPGPVVVAKGDRVDVDELVPGWWAWATGASRWSSTAASSPSGAASSTCSPPPPTSRCGSTCGATRWTGSPGSTWPTNGRSTTSARVELFGCRELVTDETMQKRAAELVGTAPWGRHQWERLADGEQFDGMESWLPWLADGEELITDLLGDDALVVLVEPRRVRDRAGELLDEESALADALASTWGLEAGAGAPRLHVALRPPARRHRGRGAVPGPDGRGAGHPADREPGLGAHPGRRVQVGRPDHHPGR